MRRSLVAAAVLGLAACTATLPMEDNPGLDGSAVISVSGGRVDYTARTEPTGNPAGWLRTTAVLRASGTTPARLEYSGCPVEVQFFRNASRTGSPAWTMFRVDNFACVQPLYTDTLAPGDTLELATVTLPREVLGDSLPAGRYYVAAVLRPNRQVIRVPAGEVELTR